MVEHIWSPLTNCRKNDVCKNVVILGPGPFLDANYWPWVTRCGLSRCNFNSLTHHLIIQAYERGWQLSQRKSAQTLNAWYLYLYICSYSYCLCKSTNWVQRNGKLPQRIHNPTTPLKKHNPHQSAILLNTKVENRCSKQVCMTTHLGLALVIARRNASIK